ncbi:MAG TPA: PQQ-binding-like beta-propeller repeat protein [Candidatus Thermoplasmatota archaeon]|nr:PQQ-binding-like beta-propeller repeat protein [Candidatus Thermoplasmatota archaeon]
MAAVLSAKRCVLGVLALVATALAGCGADPPTAGLPPALPTPPPATEWPFAGGTLDGRRASTDPAITASSLPLAIVWNHTTSGAFTGTPTVEDGRVYAATWKGQVLALDAATGRPLWVLEVGAKVTGSVTSFGGVLYFGDDKARLNAVVAATGQPLWNATLDGALHAHLYATPIVLPASGAREALVVQAVGSDQESLRLHGDNPVDFRGSVAALDPATGAELWRTPLMDANGTGAPVWGTPVWHAATDSVVFGTGNAYSGQAGKLTDAIIALRASDGAILWSYQATADDIFTQANPTSPDDDFGSTPSLVAVGDRTLAVMGQKSSVVWAIDVATGLLAWKSGAVTSGEGIVGDTAAADGRVFVPYVTQKRFAALDAATGRELWNRSLDGLGFADPVAVPGAVLAADSSGHVLALDAATGAVLWNTTLEGGVYGGLSVAGGRLFVPIVATGFLGEEGAVVAFAPGAPTGSDGTTSAGQADGSVLMEGFEFVPAVLSVPAGQAVTWRNLDPALHTVTFVAGGQELVADTGEAVTWTFTEPGTYEYYCRPHASQAADGTWIGMTGTIIVG